LKSHASLIVLTALILLNLPQLSFSAEVYPGSNCHAYYGTTSEDFTNGHRAIKNNSTLRLWVNCPIPISFSTAYYDGVAVGVRSLGSNTQAVWCNISNRDIQGSWKGSGGNSLLSTGSTVIKNIKTNAQIGTYTQNLYCSLPSATEILWYSPGVFID
jgi:hypothetical protein